MGSPERHKPCLPFWSDKIGSLLAGEPSLEPLLDCLFKGDMPYWSNVLAKPSADPLAFLIRKLGVPVDEPGIRRTYDELLAKRKVRAAKDARAAVRQTPAASGPEPLWDRMRITNEARWDQNKAGVLCRAPRRLREAPPRVDGGIQIQGDS